MFFTHSHYPFAFFGEPFAFFEGPGPEGDGQPNLENNDGNGAGAGSEGGDNSNDNKKVYSQAEFEAAFGPRAKRAAETAVSGLLGKLKFEKVEDLEKFLADSRQKADAELSEIERLQKQIGEAPKAEQVKELEQQIADQDKVITGLVEGLIKDLNVPKHVVELLDGMAPTKQLEYINTHRDSFKSTPTPPNINGGDKGGGDGKNLKKKVQAKYGIRRRNRS